MVRRLAIFAVGVDGFWTEDITYDRPSDDRRSLSMFGLG